MRVAQLLKISGALGFYLPAIAPKAFKEGDSVSLLANALTSTDVLMPIDYYDAHLHFCQPQSGPGSQPENLGSILLGDRLYSSPYEINMAVSKNCSLLCSTTYSTRDAQFVNRAIKNDYMVNWLVDGLPAAQPVPGEKFNVLGFHLGNLNSGALFNHHDIVISYHQENPASFSDCSKKPLPEWEPLLLSEKSETKATFSYSVSWIPSTTPWASRWDHYLNSTDSKLHWFSIVNSLLIVMILSGMVFMILMRTVNRDIARYNQGSEEDEDISDEFGWKLVHGDVFRPPKHRTLLAVLVGNGTQILLMCAATIAFAALGILSPASRGSLPTAMLVFYLLFGAFSGFVSTRLYKLFGGEAWRKTVIMTAALIPGTLFSVFLVLNFVLIYNNSSSALPFGTIFSLVMLWILISLPLCLIGAFIGFRMPKLQVPVRTHQIPRQIPSLQSFYSKPLFTILIGGLLPFGTAFLELFFILGSIWSNRVYYVFGFLLLVFLIVVTTVSLVSVIITYFQLCNENYHWWWRSFFVGSAVSLYFFAYSIYFYWTKLDIVQVESTVLYFAWSFCGSALFGIMCGTVGLASSFWFTRRIYSVIKVD